MTVVKPYDTAKGKKEEVESMFDNIAWRYDFLNRLLSLGIDRGWRKKVVALLRDVKHDRVLDIATGTADLAIACAVLKPQQITGLDLSENMLAIGRQKIQKRGLNQIIRLQKGDSESLPFETDSFDAITVAFGVRNFENLHAGLAEMHRVLKPGGCCIVLEFSKPRNPMVAALYRFYFHAILPRIGRLFSKDARAYTYLPESVEQFPAGQDFLNELQRCGFQASQFFPLSFGIASIYKGVK